jgi:hypothetical protein
MHGSLPRWIRWAFVAAVLALAVVGTISLIEDPPWSDDEGSPRVLRDYKADINLATSAHSQARN